MSAPLLKIDLHVHTCYSIDAVTTLKDVVAYAKMRGLHGVAITDHGTLAGALRLAQTKELIVIPGVEIKMSRGHVLALNVTTPIPLKLSPSETIQRIHEAGGIAVAAHPSTIYKAGWRIQTNSSIQPDAIEVINSASFPFFFSTYLSRRIAVSLDLPQTAGSDSHLPQTIGMAYTLIEAESEVEEIVKAIKKGATVPQGKAIPLKARFKKAFLGSKRGCKDG